MSLPDYPSLPSWAPHPVFSQFFCISQGLEQPPELLPVSSGAPVPFEVKGRETLRQLPPSCIDSWLPSEARQYREMFAPKQLRGFRNCLTLPRKANSCSSTLLPPRSGTSNQSWRGGPAERSPEQKRSYPPSVVRGSSVASLWGRGLSCPPKSAGSSVPDSGLHKSQIVNIYLESMALDSSGLEIVKIAL